MIILYFDNHVITG